MILNINIFFFDKRNYKIQEKTGATRNPPTAPQRRKDTTKQLANNIQPSKASNTKKEKQLVETTNKTHNPETNHQFSRNNGNPTTEESGRGGDGEKISTHLRIKVSSTQQKKQ